MRQRWTDAPGKIFAAYLMFNGFERFWVEKIRVNATFDFLGMTMTRAELISVCVLFRRGVVGVGHPEESVTGLGRPCRSLLLKRQADAVDAVPSARLSGAIGEDMTEVAVAP